MKSIATYSVLVVLAVMMTVSCVETLPSDMVAPEDSRIIVKCVLRDSTDQVCTLHYATSIGGSDFPPVTDAKVYLEREGEKSFSRKEFSPRGNGVWNLRFNPAEKEEVDRKEWEYKLTVIIPGRDAITARTMFPQKIFFGDGHSYNMYSSAYSEEPALCRERGLIHITNYRSGVFLSFKRGAIINVDYDGLYSTAYVWITNKFGLHLGCSHTGTDPFNLSDSLIYDYDKYAAYSTEDYHQLSLKFRDVYMDYYPNYPDYSYNPQFQDLSKANPKLLSQDNGRPLHEGPLRIVHDFESNISGLPDNVCLRVSRDGKTGTIHWKPAADRFWLWSEIPFNYYDMEKRLALNSVSPEMDRYLKSVYSYSARSNTDILELAYSDVDCIYTNIENGLGIFGAINTWDYSDLSHYPLAFH